MNIILKRQNQALFHADVFKNSIYRHTLLYKNHYTIETGALRFYYTIFGEINQTFSCQNLLSNNSTFLDFMKLYF